MHVFEGKNWISIFWIPYFSVLPFCAKLGVEGGGNCDANVAVFGLSDFSVFVYASDSIIWWNENRSCPDLWKQEIFRDSQRKGKKAVHADFLGRARQSRDGLMESSSCSCCGPPTLDHLDPRPPNPETPLTPDPWPQIPTTLRQLTTLRPPWSRTSPYPGTPSLLDLTLSRDHVMDCRGARLLRWRSVDLLVCLWRLCLAPTPIF